MSKLIALIFWTALVLGCSERAPITEGQPPEDLYSPDLENVDEPIGDIVKTFSSFDEFSAFIEQGTELTLYEGLPHDIWESEAYDKERKKANVVEIDKTLFYAEPIPVSIQHAIELKTLMSSRSSFVPFRGPKACGGFHADWCLTFKNGDKQYNAFLCFGCHELIVYHDGERILYCDIWNIEQFKKLLDPMHTNRPAERLDDSAYRAPATKKLCHLKSGYYSAPCPL